MIEHEREREYRAEFCLLLSELAKSQTLLEDDAAKDAFYNRLENLYRPNDDGEVFRHFYSDIFSTLSGFIQNEEGAETADMLVQNIALLYEEYQPIDFDISGSLKKLYDHVSLDVARLTYNDATNRQALQEQAIKDIQRDVDIATNTLKDLDEDHKTIKDSMQHMQREYITILGIFAAIVLAFVGGMVFSTSVLENMAGVSIFRLIFVMDMVGMMFLNIINLLIRLVLFISGDSEDKVISIRGDKYRMYVHCCC